MQEPTELRKESFEDPMVLRDCILAESDDLLARSRIEEARTRLQQLRKGTIDDRTVDETDKLFARGLRAGRRVVATCDPTRTARPGEQVVIYGNYPYFFDNLLVN